MEISRVEYGIDVEDILHKLDKQQKVYSWRKRHRATKLFVYIYFLLTVIYFCTVGYAGYIAGTNYFVICSTLVWFFISICMIPLLERWINTGPFHIPDSKMEFMELPIEACRSKAVAGASTEKMVQLFAGLPCADYVFGSMYHFIKYLVSGDCYLRVSCRDGFITLKDKEDKEIVFHSYIDVDDVCPYEPCVLTVTETNLFLRKDRKE